MMFLRQIVPLGVDKLIDYFDQTYCTGTYREVDLDVGDNAHLRRGFRRVPPRFSPELWNVADATINGDPRTNNLSEGWNNQ